MRWKMVEESPTYQVSDHGDVRRTTDSRRAAAWSLLKPRTDRNGYTHFILSEEGERRFFLCHRLVAKAFIGDPPKGKPFVNHINHDKSDNRVSNLEWCSRVENARHAWLCGRYDLMRKVSVEDYRQIVRRRVHGEKIVEIAKSYPQLSYSGVRSILHRMMK